MGPQACPVGANGCATKTSFGYCTCAGTGNASPITLKLETIKGQVVGMADTSIATSAFNPTTGDLILTGIDDGTTKVAVEAQWHNTPTDIHTAKTPADDDYISYRYSLPLVLTIKVGTGISSKTIPITGITLDKTTASLTVGQTLTLKETITPSNTTDSKALTWESSNPNVATVDAQGKVTAKTAGTTVITAKTVNHKTSTCTLTVEPANTTALTTSITAATTELNSAALSPDGKDIDPSKKWVTKATKDALNAAITSAQTVKNNPASTQAQIDAAKATLDKAVSTFNAAKKDGTKSTPTTNPPTAKFKDVPANHPYAKQIEFLANSKVIDGYANGNFGVNDKVARQQFAKLILGTMALSDAKKYTPKETDTHKFKDVPHVKHASGNFYPYHHVALASKLGITYGVTPTQFNPWGNITRAQVISMVVRSAGTKLTKAAGKTPFTFNDYSHGANVKKAYANGLLTGLQGLGKNYNFYAPATRGEVAVILYNLSQVK
jgi:uncharacterized protein YjdB